MRISDWSSDVCSSDLLRQGDYVAALRARDEWDALLDAQPTPERGDKEQAKSKVWRAEILARMGQRAQATRLLDEGMPSFDEGGEARNRAIGLNVRLLLACDGPVPASPGEALPQALELATAMRGDKRRIGAQAHALAGLCEFAMDAHARRSYTSIVRANWTSSCRPAMPPWSPSNCPGAARPWKCWANPWKHA